MDIALYLRLSIADGDLKSGDKDESNSIENQRDLLKRYVEANEELTGEIVEYIDDGYTGTNFNRPAFRQMIEDAKKGKIGTIITKDLSRLGRDYIGVGDYLEQIFPVLGVRYIAVNSNYDSKAYSGTTMGLDMQVSNLINHLYSRDISKKMKSAVRTKWRQGKSTSGRLPFGYRKDADARGGWAVDPEPAKIVRQIFDKAIEGMNTKQIAEYLNEQNTVTPGQYREKRDHYGGKRVVPDKEALWDTGKVRVILGKYEYTGAFVQHYREKVQIGSNITRKVPERDRIITEDAHDAIVTKEEFEAAQSAIRSAKSPEYKIASDYLLRGKVRCGNCHLVMAHHDLAYDGTFYCGHKLKSGEKSDCCGDYISEKSVERTVYVALRRQFWQIQKIQEQSQDIDDTPKTEVRQRCKELESQIDVKQAERVRQYVAYAEGQISLEKYLLLNEALTQEIADLKVYVQELEEEAQADSGLEAAGSKLLGSMEQALEEGKLTRQIVDEFIDTVYVYDADHIEVVFTFEDLLKQITDTDEGGCDREIG